MKVGSKVRVIKDFFALRKGDIGTIVLVRHALPNNALTYGVAFDSNSKGTYKAVHTVARSYLELLGEEKNSDSSR